MTGAKMTARAYLEARGWTTATGFWADPTANHPAQTEACDHYITPTDAALTIQRARDAEEERRAWVAFAAPLQHRMTLDVTSAQNLAAHHADAMLRIYRARFAVEIVADPEAQS